MTQNYLEKYAFGILYPNNTVGIGYAEDILAFFKAIEYVCTNPSEEYPNLWLLRNRAIFGAAMFELFQEVENLQRRFEDVSLDSGIIDYLGLDIDQTKLNAGSENLAGLFARVFDILVNKASSFIKIASNNPKRNILETGSVRIGPIEPIWVPFNFYKLPASAFDDQDPPLWLRDEIFDQEFYKGKV